MRKWKNSKASGGRKIHGFNLPRSIILTAEPVSSKDPDEITEGVFKGFARWRKERYGDILPKQLILRSSKKN